jgi:hypothetical protein
MLWLVMLKFALCPRSLVQGNPASRSRRRRARQCHLPTNSWRSFRDPVGRERGSRWTQLRMSCRSFGCRIVLLSFSNSSSMLIMHAGLRPHRGRNHRQASSAIPQNQAPALAG